MFYGVLMEKTALRSEQNYHSRYLSERQRNEAFRQANKRRAKRKTGLTTGRKAGAVAGSVLGGLGGGVIGASTGRGGIGRTLIGTGAGALIGGGLGYGMGMLGDENRDSRTREARNILKMSPRKRADLLDSKRARRLEMEDRMRRHEERAHREQIRRELQSIRMGR
ncbi:MAG: hypothetical protein VXZ72_01585 [Chlamydiota bacterium]|nr:hypothetical protein [Chlamydiota bacterium]